MRRTLVTATALSLLVGCTAGDVEQAGPSVAVSDSAGVRIVEYPGPLPGDSIPLRVVWRHGDDPGEYEFQMVFPGALTPDGSGFVADVGNREVMRLNPDGSHTILARSGEGPEEVGGPFSMIYSPDGSVLVSDRPNQKMLRFRGDSLAEIIRAEGSTFLRLRPIAAGEDGVVIMTTASYNSRFEVPWLDGHMVRMTFDPLSADTIASYPMAARSDRESPTAFGYSGWVTGGLSGLIEVRTDRPQVVWRDFDGAVTTITRWSPDAAFVDDSMIQRFKEILRADLIRVNPQMTREDAEVFANERVASYIFDPNRPLPVMRFAHMGQDGRVWVEEFTAGGDPMRLGVLESDGTPLGTVHLPFPIRFLDANGQHLLGIATGDLGVQSVVLFEYEVR